ncbi:MAG: TIGR04552 family protein, partial [Myxococcota bacterium]
AGVANEFSGRGYQILNFVADLPVRVEELFEEPPVGRGSVVFVLAEFQVVDLARRDANETGENSHQNYKHRQYQRVRERLLREPKRAQEDGKKKKKKG